MRQRLLFLYIFLGFVTCFRISPKFILTLLIVNSFFDLIIRVLYLIVFHHFLHQIIILFPVIFLLSIILLVIILVLFWFYYFSTIFVHCWLSRLLLFFLLFHFLFVFEYSCLALLSLLLYFLFVDLFFIVMHNCQFFKTCDELFEAEVSTSFWYSFEISNDLAFIDDLLLSVWLTVFDFCGS